MLTRPTLSIEVLAAKDSQGVASQVLLAVPTGSQLKQADQLLIDQRTASMTAWSNGRALDVKLPSPALMSRDSLRLLAGGKEVLIAEFSALGVVAAYRVRLEVRS